MEFIKKNLLAVIVAGAAVLALILGMIFPGAVAEMGGAKYTVATLGLAFGGAKYKVSAEGMSATAKVGDGGASIFGLLSVLALIAGIVLVILSIKKGEKLAFIGSILVAVAGLFMLLLLVAGTDVTQTIAGTKYSAKFTETFEQFKLGFGAIVYAILAIAGGAFGIVNKFKKLI